MDFKIGLAVCIAAFSCTTSCAPVPTEDEKRELGTTEQALDTASPIPLNDTVGREVLYEVQVRTANACVDFVGTDAQKQACRDKAASSYSLVTTPESFAVDGVCDLGFQRALRLGTLEDMRADTSDFRQGITLRHIGERVGASTLWMMPLFPNNDLFNVPWRCDTLGSPYAVRDYMHVSGRVSRTCNLAHRDEYSDQPCWGNETGNDAFGGFIGDAHGRGLKVMLDLALNHFGHNYRMYDTMLHRPVRDRVAAGEDLNALWAFDATYDPALLHPEVLDRVEELSVAGNASTLAALRAKCPQLSGDALVRSFGAFREAFDHERNSFDCSNQHLEFQLPAFYMGRDSVNPSLRIGDNLTNHWSDVKFLFHNEGNRQKQWEFPRVREYMFRIVNYWASRGVDGFRLDHTTDDQSGLGANEWRYVIEKANYYNVRRGGKPLMFLAEEFHKQRDMAKVADVMTDGYVGDMRGRVEGTDKNTFFVQNIINNSLRFDDLGRTPGSMFIMTGLETHDEPRLIHNPSGGTPGEKTGWDRWLGAGFYGVGATFRSTPMMLMGQELGERSKLGFKLPDFLRSRFPGEANHMGDADALVNYYGAINRARRSFQNRALRAEPFERTFLKTKTGTTDTRIFAQMSWSNYLGRSVAVVFHNLWKGNVEQTYRIEDWAAAPERANIVADRDYQIVDMLTEQKLPGCRRGSDVRNNFFVRMDSNTAFAWYRIEPCGMPAQERFTDPASTVKGPHDYRRTVVFIKGITRTGQDMFIRGGIDHGASERLRGITCADWNNSPNYKCAVPVRHRNLRNNTTVPWKAGEALLDWYGQEWGQNAKSNAIYAEGTALDWTTNSWPAAFGPKRTVASDGFGEEPLNQFGDHYWMLDVDMDCNKAFQAADGSRWFEVKSFISNGPGWEPDIAQAGAPYASGNHFAQCGKVSVFERGSASSQFLELPSFQ